MSILLIIYIVFFVLTFFMMYYVDKDLYDTRGFRIVDLFGVLCASVFSPISTLLIFIVIMKRNIDMNNVLRKIQRPIIRILDYCVIKPKE